VAALPCASCVLDGEALAARHRRPAEALPGDAARSASAADPAGQVLSAFFFDLLEVDGDDLCRRPDRRPLRPAHSAGAPPLLVDRLVTADATAAGSSPGRPAKGHEGVVVKALDPHTRRDAAAPVDQGEAGPHPRPGGAGGRARQRTPPRWLSNIHLGARDPATGGFVMLGKTFKGMTDAMLAWQTEHFEELKVPTTVGVAASPRAGGGDRLRRRSSARPATPAGWPCGSPG
jgi:DNA ligase-1